jgi:uncharacterized protein (TIGR02646 family)
MKPAIGPAKLVEGVALVANLEALRLADPDAGASRKDPFKFEKRIYGAAVVKKALRKAQHDKCCYCEGVFVAHASGHVEHFRPKTRFRQGKGEPFEYPAYYWLAYSWSKLYFSCEICNSVGKRELFPVADPAQRPRSGNDPRPEVPEILDPGGPDDPRDHIKFRGAAPEGITSLGKKTISALGLDRGHLTTARLKHLKRLYALRDLANLATDDLDAATLVKCQAAAAELKSMGAPEAEYSAMAQDFLAE